MAGNSIDRHNFPHNKIVLLNLRETANRIFLPELAVRIARAFKVHREQLLSLNQHHVDQRRPRLADDDAIPSHVSAHAAYANGGPDDASTFISVATLEVLKNLFRTTLCFTNDY